MRAKSLNAAVALTIEPISRKAGREFLLAVVAPPVPRITFVNRTVPVTVPVPRYISQTIAAVQHIRRMRGGAQAQLMRCSDGHHYVVKFQNNPQGARTLANELLAAHLAAWVSLPIPPIAVVEVDAELISANEELVIQLGHGRTPLHPGKCFGSRYASDQFSNPTFPLPAVLDFMPDQELRKTTNLADFAGMLMFDKWTCNTDGRQVVYVQVEGNSAYQAFMIDNGFCFNAAQWNFPDSRIRGVYPRPVVYDSIRGFEAFEPWLDRLERGSDIVTLALAARQIPTEWYHADHEALARMLTILDRRRRLVRELLWGAWKAKRECFEKWA